MYLLWCRVDSIIPEQTAWCACSDNLNSSSLFFCCSSSELLWLQHRMLSLQKYKSPHGWRTNHKGQSWLYGCQYHPLKMNLIIEFQLGHLKESRVEGWGQRSGSSSDIDHQDMRVCVEGMVSVMSMPWSLLSSSCCPASMMWCASLIRNTIVVSCLRRKRSVSALHMCMVVWWVQLVLVYGLGYCVLCVQEEQSFLFLHLHWEPTQLGINS